MKRSNLTSRSGLCGMLLAAGGMLAGQTLTTTSPSVTPPNLIVERYLPDPVRNYVRAFGGRITKPGSERTLLNGTYSAPSGSGAAQLTWEAPGSFRFDRADQPAKPLIYDAAAAVLRTSNLSQGEADILESLLDDSAERFFYSFSKGEAHRYLGSGFRADDGSAENYAGPWYDIYVVNSPVKTGLGDEQREKFYYFDTQTGLLQKVRYVANGFTRIATEYRDWTIQKGNAFPGKVERTENDVEVFTFAVTTAAVSPSAADGKFTVQ